MIVGLEIHLQLNTKTKLFCSCPNDPTAPPNTNICPICLGLPGSRPSLNRKALIYGIACALLLKCKLNRKIFFSRKAYFYPDLPKNFQITQYEVPLGYEGIFKGIRIKRVHLEEDPAKLVYPKSMKESEYCLIDYNRSGIPLVEIVTYPDFKNAEEIKKFLKSLLRDLSFIGIFDPTKNSWRADANVSLEKGYRVEIKNLGSIPSLIKAITFEIARQKMLKRRGIKIHRETRIWDEKEGKTIAVRRKEMEEEYGYILEPDLPFFEIKDELIRKAKILLKALPENRIKRILENYGIKEKLAESIVYNKLESAFQLTQRILKDPNLSAIIVGNYLAKSLNYLKKDWKEIDKNEYIKAIKALKEKKITFRLFKEVIKDICSGKGFTLKEKKIDVDSLIDNFIKSHPELIEKMRKDRKVINYIVGEILKLCDYRVDPKLIIKKIEERIRTHN